MFIWFSESINTIIIYYTIALGSLNAYEYLSKKRNQELLVFFITLKIYKKPGFLLRIF